MLDAYGSIVDNYRISGQQGFGFFIELVDHFVNGVALPAAGAAHLHRTAGSQDLERIAAFFALHQLNNDSRVNNAFSG